MQVRFGFTCRGQTDLALDDFPKLVDNLERLGFDSIWLPEIMLNGPFDPLVALAHAAARTERLKIGAYVIVPGRNPVRLARELANLDRLSQGRLLLIMVLGQPDAPELLAQGVNKAECGALLSHADTGNMASPPPFWSPDRVAVGDPGQHWIMGKGDKGR